MVAPSQHTFHLQGHILPEVSPAAKLGKALPTLSPTMELLPSLLLGEFPFVALVGIDVILPIEGVTILFPASVFSKHTTPAEAQMTGTLQSLSTPYSWPTA